MKMNWVLVLLVGAIATLLGYGFYAGTENIFMALGSGILFFLTLSGTFSISFGRGSANVKVLSFVFFILSFIEQLIFGFVGFRKAPYIIISGILILVYVMIFYAVVKTLK